MHPQEQQRPTGRDLVLVDSSLSKLADPSVIVNVLMMSSSAPVTS
jgi:hypothetical protein